jgi:hypothetical protein
MLAIAGQHAESVKELSPGQEKVPDPERSLENKFQSKLNQPVWRGHAALHG